MNKEKDEIGKKNTKTTKGSVKSKPFFSDESIKFVRGILSGGFALYLLLACVAYLFWWKTDLSLPDSDIVSGPDIAVKNWSGKSGHFLAKMIIGYGFGYGAFFIPLIFGSVGLYLLNFPKIKPLKLIAKFTFAAIILSLILGFIFGQAKGYLISGPGGAQGYIVTRWLKAFMGMIGTGVVLTFITISYLVFALKVKPESFGLKIPAFLKFKKHANDKTVETDKTDTLIHGTETDSEIESVIPEAIDREKNDVEFFVKNMNQYKEPEDLDDEEEEEEEEEVLSAGSII